SIPLQAGGIEKLVSLDSSHLLIAAAVGLYIYNSSTRQVGKLSTYLIAKEVRLRDGVVYLATTTGVASFRLGQPGRQSWHINEKLFGKSNRCRSITFAGDTLYAAYSDGVYLVHNGKMEKLLYKDAPVFASNLHTYSSRILISTYNQGLLILQKKKISTLTDKNGLASNFIQDITETGGAAWLVYEDHVQQLGSSLPVMESKAITFAPVSDIEDFEVFRNRLYIVAGGVVYSMNQTQPATKSNISTAIDKLMVNEKTVFGVSRLPHSQNNLQFHVSTPFFSPFAKILYQYRIKSQTDSTWQTATPGQTTFTILALPPGSYTFEVVAIDNSREVISKPAFYRFQILPPWYQTWYFRTALVLLLLGLSFAALRFYFKNRLRKQRQEYEKILAVQGERQRIAAEIHDDIGAGLSAVRLLTEMVQHKVEKSEIHKDVNQIQTYLSDLSLKIKEVIWSLNASNDRLENLLFYIQRQALALFENSGIELKISLPPHPIENIAIQGEKRRHIYLAVKEALHNCLKHAQARHCWLQMKLEAEVLLITVADDGIGFDHVKNNGAGNGIFNMHKRMEQVDGSFRISTTEATEVHFSIPLNEDE
ncbi:MAG: histidine kinase, partial [Chitinophagaceae bacterium]